MAKMIYERTLDFGATILFFAFIVFAFVKSGSELWGLVPIGSILIVILLRRQGKLEKLKFGRDGIEATMAKAHEATEEAREATKEIKELMKATSVAVLGLIKRTGRMGGYTYDEKEQIKQDILTRLSEMGISEDELKTIEDNSRWHDYTACDYVFHILQGRHFPSGNSFEPGPQLAEAIELRRGTSRIATPDEVLCQTSSTAKAWSLGTT